MAEYIDREALLEEIADTRLQMHTGYPKRSMTQKDMLEIIKTFPAADVAPVIRCEIPDAVELVQIVRCKDCVHYGELIEGFYDCLRLGGMDDAGPDDFCSYGEKVETETTP